MHYLKRANLIKLRHLHIRVAVARIVRIRRALLSLPTPLEPMSQEMFAKMVTSKETLAAHVTHLRLKS